MDTEASARLKRGAVVLLILFWVAHLIIMLVRAELNDHRPETFIDSLVRRSTFALFGAFIGYLLYRCLHTLRSRPFIQQAVLGASFALVAACIQAAGNNIVFSGGDRASLPNFLYALMYWFWFYFCWTTAYLALAYSITVQEQERHAAQLAVQAREAQVRALRYQVNPHFLFNTLNAIAALVRDAPARAEEMVVQLSEFFRRSLAVNPMEDVTLAQEVDLQRLYLEIERTRFPDRLTFKVELEGDSAEAPVPALLLQPLVENAVKHGVARSDRATSISIRGKISGAVLEIIVENDAAASGAAANGERIGLANVRERLRSRFGTEASLESSAIAGGGYRNRLLIPLRR